MRSGLCLFFLVSLASAGPSNLAINVVVDLTPAGRKAVHSSPDKPVYYFPILRPYQQEGEVFAREPSPPPPASVARLLGSALARQGYLVASGSHRPNLFLVIFYGSLNPTLMTDPGATLASGAMPLSGRVSFDDFEMGELVGGTVALETVVPWRREMMIPDLHQPRYFVLVTAYDYAAYGLRHKKEILWQAKMSVPGIGVDFAQVVQPLIDQGAPWFGRSTVPQQFTVPAVPEGRVQVGQPTVRPY